MAYFTSGEHGKKEAGDYFFWTAYGEDKFGDWKTTGRATINLPPPDRFLRTKRESKTVKNVDDRRIYAALYRRLLTIHGIRAATYREIANWISTHKSDAKYIRFPVKIRGKSYKKIAPIV